MDRDFSLLVKTAFHSIKMNKLQYDSDIDSYEDINDYEVFIESGKWNKLQEYDSFVEYLDEDKKEEDQSLCTISLFDIKEVIISPILDYERSIHNKDFLYEFIIKNEEIIKGLYELIITLKTDTVSFENYNLDELDFKNLLIILFNVYMIIELETESDSSVGIENIRYHWERVYQRSFKLQKGDIAFLDNNYGELYLYDGRYIRLINTTIKYNDRGITHNRLKKFRNENVEWYSEAKINYENEVYHKITIEEIDILKEYHLTEESDDIFSVDDLYYLDNDVLDQSMFNKIRSKDFVEYGDFHIKDNLNKTPQALNILIMAEWLLFFFQQRYGIEKNVETKSDYTFLITEYVKAVELFICERLENIVREQNLSLKIVINKNGDFVKIGDYNWRNRVTLGNFAHFFENSDSLMVICNECHEYKKDLSSLLWNWVDKVRNDNFHKDTVEKYEDALEKIKATYKVIALLDFFLK